MNRKGSISMRCRKCNTLRFVKPAEQAKATRPRCLWCGDTLVETKTTLKNARVRRKSRAKEKQGIRCRGCGIKFVATHNTAENNLICHLMNGGRGTCAKTYSRKEAKDISKFSGMNVDEVEAFCDCVGA